MSAYYRYPEDPTGSNPDNLVSGEGGFTINGTYYRVYVLDVAPAIESPTQNASNVGVTGTIAYASAFDLNFDGASDVHVSSDWELSTDPNFTTIVASSYNSTTNLTSWPLP